MSDTGIYVGDLLLKQETADVDGKYVHINGEDFYRISNYDQMRPFFISLVSHSDLWLFISTTGGLTAGRKNEASSLFPYYTDDKIAESAETTGSKTVLQIGNEKRKIWEPFSERYSGLYSISRNLYKNVTGNKLIFEEVNHDLGLQYQYSWQFSDQYGLVKRSEIQNLTNEGIDVNILDGIQNIVPYGVSPALQSARSNLSNAYKRSELESGSQLGVFALSSMIVDKAEPSEALKSTTVWCAGVKADAILLSGLQLGKFRYGGDVSTETDVKAEPGSYFVSIGSLLEPKSKQYWYMVAEVNQDHKEVRNLIHNLTNNQAGLQESLVQDIEDGTEILRKLVGAADGLQLTNDKLSNGRHYSNVLFNVMRGGIFDDQYRVYREDLIDYASQINGPLVGKSNFFDSLESELDYQGLISKALSSKDPDIIRICYEYLPLTFSRRHGDPSRPWNKFSIETRKEDGSKLRNYEGNWRDIFQNWEALGLSFPGFVISMITKFVNASTIDGYNPYRISRGGIDWEVIEPDDPWSYIGYWGDHQIIYLLKLMEVAKSHSAESFQELLSRPEFVYANVPYRIKSYNEIVEDPQDTIDFDQAEEERIEKRVSKIGGDGKLVYNDKDSLIRSNLTEKLLVTLLAKLSNFVPGAGIWLNTQRPEWNDANNALVGNGVSMVTLYYIRRFLTFCDEVFSDQVDNHFSLNSPVFDLLKKVEAVLNENKGLLGSALTDEDRKSFVDKLGRSGEAYRNKAYAGFDDSKPTVSGAELIGFFKTALEYVDHSIKLNRREDGLYHAYNLIQFEGDALRIEYLYEMLEGQVAVLSSGLLSAKETLEVLDALKESEMYREDQFSYMLYPNRQLPKFLERNVIPEDFVGSSKLAKALLDTADDSILSGDEQGNHYFNGDFHNAQDLRKALDDLESKKDLESLVKAEYQNFLDVFEEMYNHKAFTGRSGTFFGYEGLGSIYWHMVSKLLLAVHENIYWGGPELAGTETLGKLIDHYYEIRAGIGINKSPEVYGAIPTDPYSHTPGNKGAQQPGMTGQVKEDVISRWAELGLQIKDGEIVFNPILLNPDEFLNDDDDFKYFGVDGKLKEIKLKSGQLAFTYCQVPFVYQRSNDKKITVKRNDGADIEINSNGIPKDISSEIFRRSGSVKRITFGFPVN